jgi:hypothetical protein
MFEQNIEKSSFILDDEERTNGDVSDGLLAVPPADQLPKRKIRAEPYNSKHPAFAG